MTEQQIINYIGRYFRATKDGENYNRESGDFECGCYTYGGKWLSLNNVINAVVEMLEENGLLNN